MSTIVIHRISITWGSIGEKGLVGKTYDGIPQPALVESIRLQPSVRRRPLNGGLRDSGQNEDRPFGLQHRVGYLIRLWRYQVDVRACGMSVEQHIVQKFGFLIGRVLAPDRDNPLKRPNIEARRLDFGLQVLQPVLEASDLVQYALQTPGIGGQLFGSGHRLPCCVGLELQLYLGGSATRSARCSVPRAGSCTESAPWPRSARASRRRRQQSCLPQCRAPHGGRGLLNGKK